MKLAPAQIYPYIGPQFRSSEFMKYGEQKEISQLKK